MTSEELAQTAVDQFASKLIGFLESFIQIIPTAPPPVIIDSWRLLQLSAINMLQVEVKDEDHRTIFRLMTHVAELMTERTGNSSYIDRWRELGLDKASQIGLH